MIIYPEYKSSGPCCFRQEECWKLHFENLFFTPSPTYATNQNNLNNFARELKFTLNNKPDKKRYIIYQKYECGGR